MSDERDVLSERLDNLIKSFDEHRVDSKQFMSVTSTTLSEIRRQTTITNGRVNGHDREMEEVKSTISKAIWWFLGIQGAIIASVVASYLATHR